MSRPATIVLAEAQAEPAAPAAPMRTLREGLDTPLLGPIRVIRLHGFDTGRLGARLRRARADLAILVLGLASVVPDDLWLESVRAASLVCPVLVVAPEILPQQLLQLLNAGMSDHVIAPLRTGDLVPRVARILQARPTPPVPAERLDWAGAGFRIHGQSSRLQAQLEKLPLIASCEANVLILGETGTGKELFARAIHYLSRRGAGPFVAVNCGAIPADLVENELFGHEAGAYTTAMSAQAGLLREANGGSLFLDEIDTLTPALQVKLLRFLQDKSYRPLGTSKPRHADVRMIAASNLPLEDAMRTGRFRRDLFYRLSVLSLELPTLRDRPEDIPLLARHFLQKYAAEFNRPARDFAPGAIQSLLTQPWPGNVRELENLIQRAVLLCETAAVEARHLGLPAKPRESGDTSFKRLKAQAVRQFERQYLSTLLEEHQGNISAAARAAGKNRRAFWELLRKHHLLPPGLLADAQARPPVAGQPTPTVSPV